MAKGRCQAWNKRTNRWTLWGTGNKGRRKILRNKSRSPKKMWKGVPKC